MKKILAAFLALAGLWGIAILFCKSSPTTSFVNREMTADSTTITDLAGRRVSWAKPVQRIVLIRSRDVYELSLLLGDELENKLVAWGPDLQAADHDAYEKFVERYPRLKDIPVLGSVFQDALNVEYLLTLQPDLVIADTFMLERRYKSLERLERSGLPVVFLDFSHDPLSGPQQSLRLLGKVLGKDLRAEEIAHFVDAEIQAVLSRLATVQSQLPTVYLECGNLGVASYGNTYGYNNQRHFSSWGTVLERMRCQNIAASFVCGMAPINPEYLFKANPDVIIVTGAHWVERADTMRLGYDVTMADARVHLTAFAQRPGWSALQAVKNGRVHGLFHGFCMHTSNFACLQQLAKWLYPNLFHDLKPEERLKEFHDRFMPFRLSGTWMVTVKD